MNECPCECHCTLEMVAGDVCCAEPGVLIDFWAEVDTDVQMFGSAVTSSKPAQRSANYEDPEDWMRYIINHRTGLPVWDEGTTKSLRPGRKG